METDEMKYQDNFDQDNFDQDSEEEVETVENTESNEEVFEDNESISEEEEETETVEGYIDGFPSPVPVEFTLLTETVDFDTPLNDLGFASVAICISLFLTFMVVAWRFEK